MCGGTEEKKRRERGGERRAKLLLLSCCRLVDLSSQRLVLLLDHASSVLPVSGQPHGEGERHSHHAETATETRDTHREHERPRRAAVVRLRFAGSLCLVLCCCSDVATFIPFAMVLVAMTTLRCMGVRGCRHTQQESRASEPHEVSVAGVEEGRCCRRRGVLSLSLRLLADHVVCWAGLSGEGRNSGEQRCADAVG